MKQFIKNYGVYIILALLVYTPLFSGLDVKPIRIWDEAQLAVNAIEMQENGNLLVTHFKGEPDMWNTKPPYLIWWQAASMKVFGIGELAVRLPSAIAGLLTCVIFMLFALHYIKDVWFGFISILVLITINGYINQHVTRTGDYDAMLILFTTAAGLLFFLLIEHSRTKLFYWFFGIMTLAVLTKGIAAMLFAPALLIYAVYRNKLGSLLRNKHLYVGMAGFLIIGLGYYFLREVYNPGYLEAVRKNELGGRFLKLLFREERPFMYYVNNMKNIQLKHWYYVVPFGILAGLLQKDRRIKELTIFSTMMIVVHLLVISISKTKFSWYNAPEFPFIALILGIGIYTIFRALQNSSNTIGLLKLNVAQLILLLFVFAYPYQFIYNKTHKPKEWNKEKKFYEIGYFLQDALRGKEDVDGYYVMYDGYNTQNLFYLKALQTKGVAIDFKDWKALDPGDKVIAHQPQVKEYIEEHYSFRLTEKDNNIFKYKINARKE